MLRVSMAGEVFFKVMGECCGYILDVSTVR